MENGNGAGKKKESAVQIKKLVGENGELQEKIREMEQENAKIKKESEFLEDAASFYTELRSVRQADRNRSRIKI
jgi:cell division protein FtsB